MEASKKNAGKIKEIRNMGSVKVWPRRNDKKREKDLVPATVNEGAVGRSCL